MKIKKQARTTARQLLRYCVVENRVDEDRVRQVVTQVTTSKPRDYLSILVYFQHLLKLELDRRTARVESACPLEDPMRKQLQDHLTHRHGPGLEFLFAVSPSLIGGLRIQVGSDVYDGSILTRLKELGGQF
jgi:F-type H+-transporting ATPase subunit delta